MTERMTAAEFQKLPKTRSKKNDFNAEDALAFQLTKAGVPFERQFYWHETRRFRADFLIYNNQLKVSGKPLLLVECIGGVWSKKRLGHSSGAGQTYDLERLNEAILQNYFVMQFTGELLSAAMRFEQFNEHWESALTRDSKTGRAAEHA